MMPIGGTSHWCRLTLVTVPVILGVAWEFHGPKIKEQVGMGTWDGREEAPGGSGRMQTKGLETGFLGSLSC